MQFVLEESECLKIRGAIEGVVERILAEIVTSRCIICHISIDILCLNSIGQAIRIRDMGILRACDCNESHTCAALTTRARKSPHRWDDSVSETPPYTV